MHIVYFIFDLSLAIIEIVLFFTGMWLFFFLLLIVHYIIVSNRQRAIMLDKVKKLEEGQKDAIHS